MKDTRVKARKHRRYDAMSDDQGLDDAHRYEFNKQDVEDLRPTLQPVWPAARSARKTLTLSRVSNLLQADVDSRVSQIAPIRTLVASGLTESTVRADGDVRPSVDDAGATVLDNVKSDDGVAARHEEPQAERRRKLLRPIGAFSREVPDLADQFAGDVERVVEFMNWYATLPAEFSAKMSPEWRRRMANAFGQMFTRHKETRVELRDKTSAEAIVAVHGREPLVVKIYTGMVRRWVIRNFHFTQKQVYKRGQIADGRSMNDAWIDESDARLVQLETKYPPASAKDLETRGYCLAEVHVTNRQSDRVLSILLRVDKTIAALGDVPEVAEFESKLLPVLEPLNWLRIETGHAASTCYRIQNPSRFVQPRSKHVDTDR